MEQENNKEQNIEIVTKKINFFQRLWFSIADISKIDDMTNEGLQKALKYFLTLVAIMAIILTSAEVYVQSNNSDKAISYLQSELPEFNIENGELSLESQEATILDGDELVKYFGSNIVLNPYIDKEEAIEQYSNELVGERNYCIAFLKNECVIISPLYLQNEENTNDTQDTESKDVEDTQNKDNKNEEEKESNQEENKENESIEGVQEYLYKDIVPQYLGGIEKTYNKQDVINAVKNNLFIGNYLIMYFVTYILVLLIMYAIYIMAVSTSYIIIKIMLRMKRKIKKAITTTIYCSSLSLILYVVCILISYVTSVQIPYMYIIAMLIIYIYIALILYKEKKEERKE